MQEFTDMIREKLTDPRLFCSDRHPLRASPVQRTLHSQRRTVRPMASRRIVEPQGKIGMTCMDLANPFFKLIANVMQQEAQKYGYEVVASSGDNDPAKQNNQLSDFVAQGCDAIFLNPVDSKAAGEGVKKAHEAGIPVFTFDVQVTDEEAKELIVSHIGSDNYQGGKLAGESMMKVTGDEGKNCHHHLSGNHFLYLAAGRICRCSEGKQQPAGDHYRVIGKRKSRRGTRCRDRHPASASGYRRDFRCQRSVRAWALTQRSRRQVRKSRSPSSPLMLLRRESKRCSKRSSTIPRSSFLARWPRGLSRRSSNTWTARRSRRSTFIPCQHYYYDDAVKDESREREQW